MSKDILLWDETLFKNAEVLEIDHIPEHFAYRDNQLQAIKYSLKPVINGMNPINCLISGPPGTGKTTAVKKIYNEIQEYVDDVIFLKVNCQIDSTRFAVISRIYKQVTGVNPPTSGISFRSLFDKTMESLVENDSRLVLTLDDINYLFYENHADEVMYSLLRAHEHYPGVKIGVIAVVSDTGAFYQFDTKVTSVFLPEEIEFPRYEYNELQGIIDDRIKNAFYPDVIPAEVRDHIVQYVDDLGDLRIGIDLLKRAGLNAEKRANRVVTRDDVDNAYESSKLLHICRSIRSLNSNEKNLLRLIVDNNNIYAGDLYKSFHEATEHGYTYFYKLINRLYAARHIDVVFSGQGKRGRSRLIKLKTSPSDVLKCLEK